MKVFDLKKKKQFSFELNDESVTAAVIA